MHITDTLDIGGAERVAINLVNLLPRERYVPHLCTTRRDGPLADLVDGDVGRLCLGRRYRFDSQAVIRLHRYIRQQDIRILHAHGSSLFMAVIASLLPPHPAVIWHIHFGRYAAEERPGRLHRLFLRRVRRVMAVNQQLVDWARRRLRIPSARVSYIPNFYSPATGRGHAIALPGQPGSRIVCVANLVPDKDHLTLIRAMTMVVRQVPAAHLILIGSDGGTPYGQRIRAEIEQRTLGDNVSLLGQRRDVPAVLAACDIGVLSSVAEGLPLALLEYGAAGLPAVTTRVGQCEQVLENGEAGILVAPRAPEELADALLDLLRSPERRTAFGACLRSRVSTLYSARRVVGRVCHLYEADLARRRN